MIEWLSRCCHCHSGSDVRPGRNAEKKILYRPMSEWPLMYTISRWAYRYRRPTAYARTFGVTWLRPVLSNYAQLSHHNTNTNPSRPSSEPKTTMKYIYVSDLLFRNDDNLLTKECPSSHHGQGHSVQTSKEKSLCCEISANFYFLIPYLFNNVYFTKDNYDCDSIILY